MAIKTAKQAGDVTTHGVTLAPYQASFVTTWEPYAKDAATSLGIPWEFVLAQWAMESGYATQTNMGQNNVGNVGNLGGGKWQNYATPTDFVSAYVASMKSDFPYFSSSTQFQNPTLAQVFGGKNSYDPGNSTYNVNVEGAYATIAKVAGLTETQILSAAAKNGNIAGSGSTKTGIIQQIFGTGPTSTGNPIAISGEPFLQALANAANGTSSSGLIATLEEVVFLEALGLALFGAGLLGLVVKVRKQV